MGVNDKIINSDDLVMELSSGWNTHPTLIKEPLQILLMAWMFGLDVPSWVLLCMLKILCYEQPRGQSLCSAQPALSICVGVFLIVLWRYG